MMEIEKNLQGVVYPVSATHRRPHGWRLKRHMRRKSYASEDFT